MDAVPSESLLKCSVTTRNSQWGGHVIITILLIQTQRGQGYRQELAVRSLLSVLWFAKGKYRYA
jgi:hypothetical protein